MLLTELASNLLFFFLNNVKGCKRWPRGKAFRTLELNLMRLCAFQPVVSASALRSKHTSALSSVAGFDGAGRARRFSAIVHNDNARRTFEMTYAMASHGERVQCSELLTFRQESGGFCLR